MTVYRLGAAPVFPDPEQADPDGLLAVGGDLRPERLLAAYAAGVFPWYERAPILWFSPDPRAVLRPARLRVPRRLRRSLRQGRFTLRFDGAFDAVVRACAEAPRPGQRGTWITPAMVEAYGELHALGFAHSAEAWLGDRLAGGLYGVSLGSAFFAESMFHRHRDASKAALVALVWQLADEGFTLFDCQVMSAHLERFGAQPWPRGRFLTALAEALAAPTRRGRWRFDAARHAARLAGPDQPAVSA